MQEGDSMSEMQQIISPESLAHEVLPGVEAELLSEGKAAPGTSSAKREAVAAVAMAASQGKSVSTEQLQAAGISSDDYDELTNQLTQIHESLGERIKDWIHHGDARIEELAKIVCERAEKLGVSTTRYLEKLQKHLLQYMISTYLLDPIPVQLSTGPSTLGATQVGLQATVTLQPSVTAGADVVQAFIASLFNLSFQLSVTYGAAASS
jgi:hypothetical protein